VPTDPKQESAGGDPKTAKDIDALAKIALDLANASVERYTKLATDAAKRIANGDTDTASWSKDASAVAANCAKDLGTAWEVWTQALNLLAGKGPGGGDPPKKDP
jgi:hypothetical protein